ncbi:MAG: heparinase II/III-family protein, partial [Pseudomonadota bacterium]
AMGFLRLHAGRTTMILDAAPPPTGAASVRAHASTLAFEMSSGRHPVVVNCGAGERFGGDWPRAARATAAHSTAQIARLSSSEIAEDGFATRRLGAWLLSVPRAVSAERTDDLNGSWILADHDGFAARYGLRHLRRLFVAPDGRDIRGEDTIEAASKAERSRFDRELGQARQLGEPFTLHFHLHPDVEPELDPGGTSARLTLPGGEVWSFRQASGELALASSAYLDPEAAAPRTTRQIVVTGRILQYRGQVTWALVRGDAAERPRAPSVVPTRTRRPRALG